MTIALIARWHEFIPVYYRSRSLSGINARPRTFAALSPYQSLGLVHFCGLEAL